jgi:hypothetical protein
MASQSPFPLLPPKSTGRRLEHFDENVYTIDPNTVLFKFIDALCGDAGAGSLKKEAFLQRLSGALDSIYGSDLDYIFGNVRFLSRATSESYAHNPMTQMLTTQKWNEVYAKDAQYRSRIREFFQACGQGNTIEGIRQAVHAAISADCQVIESWRYIDSFGISNPVGRTGITNTTHFAVDRSTGHRVPFVLQSEAATFIASQTVPGNWEIQPCRSRSEVTVVPHKATISPRESRLMLEMLNKISNADTVVTISPTGLAVYSPVTVRAVAADSTYYQVEKVVTGTPDLKDLPAPELLAVDLDPSENWLKPNSPELAPYAQFNITQEYGYFYLMGGGRRSPIDSVTYGTLQDGDRVKPEQSLEWYEQSEEFGPWNGYEKADSPDNYPGGRLGLTPDRAPALNPDRSPYQFSYTSQDDYLTKKKAEVTALGGQANDQRWRLPIQKTNSSKRTYTPDLAVAYTAPVRESTITSSWTSRRPRYFSGEQRSPSLFVRS